MKTVFYTLTVALITILAVLLTGFFPVQAEDNCQECRGCKSKTENQTHSLSADTKTLVENNNDFAFKLYSKISQEEEGNVFISPYSISSALAMTYGGARGETQKAMEKTMKFTLGQTKLHPAFAHIMNGLNKGGQEGNYQLHVANRLWGQKGFSFLTPFIELTKKYYGAGLEEVDFVKNTETARNTINKWVEEKTEKKITDLIPKGGVNTDSVLVLTNAIYFKGNWDSKFDEKSTRPAKFYIAKDKSTEVPMMNQSYKFNYCKLEGVSVLEMPYKGKNISMLIILPDARDGLKDVEMSLNSDTLTHWLSNLKNQKVKVYIPKFKMTQDYELSQHLTAMGMGVAFTSGADFSGMTQNMKVAISKVFHKTFVAVDEEGTEAAGATAVVVTRMNGGKDSVPTFRADHPFIFLIRDNTAGSILFLGRVWEPKS